MFPFIQKFNSSGSCPIYDDVSVVDKDGYVTTVRKINQPILPNPKLFDTKRMIEAGVDLQQVNTKILQSDLTSLVDDLNLPIDNNTNPSNDGE